MKIVQQKKKDKHFSELKISDYLARNQRTMLSRIIFSDRSKTLDIKEYHPQNYYTDSCVRCENIPETMHHFMTCRAYESPPCKSLSDTYGSWKKSQVLVGLAVEKIINERETIIERKKVGWADDSDSSAPGFC